MEEAERFECFSVPVPEKKSFNLLRMIRRRMPYREDRRKKSK